MTDAFQFAQDFVDDVDRMPASLVNLGPRRQELVMLRLLGVTQASVVEHSGRIAKDIKRDYDAIGSTKGPWNPMRIAIAVMRTHDHGYFDVVDGMPSVEDFGVKFFNLTDPQRKVLRETAFGKTNPEVADLLSISTNTVHNYLSTMYKEVGLKRDLFLLCLTRQALILAEVFYGDLAQFEVDRATMKRAVADNPWMGMVLELPAITPPKT